MRYEIKILALACMLTACDIVNVEPPEELVLQIVSVDVRDPYGVYEPLIIVDGFPVREDGSLNGRTVLIRIVGDAITMQRGTIIDSTAPDEIQIRTNTDWVTWPGISITL